MTLDYRSVPPTTHRVPTLREVGRSLIALGAIQWFPLVAYAVIQTYERHPRWPLGEASIFLACCFASGLIHIVCGLVIRKKLAPVARWVAILSGAILSALIAWGIALLALELMSGSGPAQKGGPFFVIFILLGLGVIGAFAYVCWQMHLIAKHGGAAAV